MKDWQAWAFFLAVCLSLLGGFTVYKISRGNPRQWPSYQEMHRR